MTCLFSATRLRVGDAVSGRTGSRACASTNAAGALCRATRRYALPSNNTRLPNLAPQIRTAFSRMASKTGLSSPGELEITFKTSDVAVCCSQRLVALAGSLDELFLQVVDGWASGQRLASLGPGAPLFPRLCASTASLHPLHAPAPKFILQAQ